MGCKLKLQGQEALSIQRILSQFWFHCALRQTLLNVSSTQQSDHPVVVCLL